MIFLLVELTNYFNKLTVNTVNISINYQEARIMYYISIRHNRDYKLDIVFTRKIILEKILQIGQ